MPLRQYIEHLYFKRFGKERPSPVLSIEKRAYLQEQQKARRRDTKRRARQPDDQPRRPHEFGNVKPDPSSAVQDLGYAA